MSRRGDAGEVHFGNDSFLDVLANMVGILIILVVIAGAHAGKRSLETAAAAKEAEVKKAEVKKTEAKADVVQPPEVFPAPLPSVEVSLPDPPRESLPEVTIATTHDQNHVRPDPDSAPGVRSPHPPSQSLETEDLPGELISRLEALHRETQTLQRQTEAEKQAVAAAQARERKSRTQLAGIHEEVAAADRELLSARERMEELQKLLQRDWSQYSGLLAATESMKQAKGPVKQVQHRLTPVSQVVSGDELHFRIENGKVAYVPLEELVERVKLQMVKQKEWMVKFRKHQGTVGPIYGFRMEYVVERQGLSVVDEVRNGGGMVRIGVTSWQIQAEEDLESETVEEALRPNSRFARQLQHAKAEAALTFWVYPESFPAFRKLQAAAHSAGFIVSGRPLPSGLPITGSPNGSRSAGQ